MTTTRPSRVGTAVAALCLVQFVDVLGVTVVVSALPDMLADVRGPASSATLVATGYAMFFGGLLMFGARLGDRIGHRRTIVASLAVYTVGAVLAAVAPSLWLLTLARCVHGAAAAGAVPSALRLLTTVASSGTARRRALAAWSAAGAAAGASGFVVGGVVSDLTSWRYIFWGYVPLAAVLAVAVLRTVPSDGRGDPERTVNVTSSLLLTAAVMALVVGTTELGEPQRGWLGAALVASSGALSVALWALDKRSAAPLLPLPLLRLPQLRRGAIGGLLNTATTSSVATLLTLYLQDTLSRSPLAAAATLLPFSLAVIIGASLAAPALRALQPERVIAAGLALIAGAVGGLAAVSGQVVAMSACLAVAGMGIGLSSVAATALGTDVDLRWRATASGVINTTAQLGTAAGIATLLLVAAATTGSPAPGTGAPTAAWAVAAVVAAAGAAGFGAVRTSGADRTEIA